MRCQIQEGICTVRQGLPRECFNGFHAMACLAFLHIPQSWKSSLQLVVMVRLDQPSLTFWFFVGNILDRDDVGIIFS